MILQGLTGWDPLVETEFPGALTDSIGFQDDVFIGADIDFGEEITRVRFRLESTTPARWDQSGTYYFSLVTDDSPSDDSVSLSLDEGETEGPWSGYTTVDDEEFMAGPSVSTATYVWWGPQPEVGSWSKKGGLVSKDGYRAFRSSHPKINQVFSEATFSGGREGCAEESIDGLDYGGSLSVEYDSSGLATENDTDYPEELPREWEIDFGNELAIPPLGIPFVRAGRIIGTSRAPSGGIGDLWRRARARLRTL